MRLPQFLFMLLLHEGGMDPAMLVVLFCSTPPVSRPSCLWTRCVCLQARSTS